MVFLIKLDYKLGLIKNKKLNMKIINKKFFSKFNYFIATGLGIGLFLMPGTIGSIVASFFWLYIKSIIVSKNKQLLIVLFFFLVGIYFCQNASKYIKKHDHKSIVLDEFISIWFLITVLQETKWNWFIFEFFLFRYLDIFKPIIIYCIHKKIKNGFGIMIDDFISSVFTIIIIFFFKLLI